MNYVLLLDVAADPVSTGISVIGGILVGIVALMLAGAAIVGFVFLIKRLRKPAGGGTRLVVGDVCLNLDNAAPQSNPRIDTTR